MPQPRTSTPAPISPQAMASRLGLADVQWDPPGRRLIWLENRPQGRTLVGHTPAEGPRDLTSGIEVRAQVAYGGGDFTIGHGWLVFAGPGGRLYRQSASGGPAVAIADMPGFSASPAVAPDVPYVAFIHSHQGQDSLNLAPLDGSNPPLVAARGADFYMQPAWHPRGGMLAWVEWDHPNMPWDGARLMQAQVEWDPLAVGRPQLVSGAPHVPVFQPTYSPDGRWLAYLQGEGDRDQLCVRDPAGGAMRVLLDEPSLIPPAWLQGMRVMAFSPDSRCLFVVQVDNGRDRLLAVDVTSSDVHAVSLTPYTSISQLSVSSEHGALAFIGSAPSIPPSVVVVEDGCASPVRTGVAAHSEAGQIDEPRPLAWQAPDGSQVRGLYYPPAPGSHKDNAPPPALIEVHSGPTRHRGLSYWPEGAFFTTRGFAVLAVNYRGSSGHGRRYLRSLYGHWGEYDVEDVLGGAGALVTRGLADPKRLALIGSSAGGLTVLHALVRHPGMFRAAICAYPVTVLSQAGEDRFKFEAHYDESLIGRGPQAAALYRERSPLVHAGAIRDPVALFHGEDDPAVPIAHSQILVEALERSGVPFLFRRFPGEGHGWRKEETITAYYAEIEAFLRRYVPQSQD